VAEANGSILQPFIAKSSVAKRRQKSDLRVVQVVCINEAHMPSQPLLNHDGAIMDTTFRLGRLWLG
jgi:hypothetical protein